MRATSRNARTTISPSIFAGRAGRAYPIKDTTANELALNNNLKSRAEIIAARGRDIEDVDREIARRQAAPAPDAGAGRRNPWRPTTTLDRRHFHPARRHGAADVVNADTYTIDAVIATNAPVARRDAQGEFDEILDPARRRSLGIDRRERPRRSPARRRCRRPRRGRGARVEGNEILAPLRMSAKPDRKIPFGTSPTAFLAI